MSSGSSTSCPSSYSEAALVDEGSSTNSPRIQHLQDLIRRLHERITELMEYNDALCHRVCDLTSNRHPRVRALQNLSYRLQERVKELEAAAHNREAEQTEDADMTDALAKRVSSLCTFNCTMAVELDVSRRLERRYRASILFMVIGIALVGIVLSIYRGVMQG